MEDQNCEQTSQQESPPRNSGVSSKKNKPRRRNKNKQTDSPPSSNSNIFVPPMPNFIPLNSSETNFADNIDQTMFYLHKSISEMKFTDLTANQSPKKVKNQQNQQVQQRKDNKNQTNNIKVYVLTLNYKLMSQNNHSNIITEIELVYAVAKQSGCQLRAILGSGKDR